MVVQAIYCICIEMFLKYLCNLHSVQVYPAFMIRTVYLTPTACSCCVNVNRFAFSYIWMEAICKFTARPSVLCSTQSIRVTHDTFCIGFRTCLTSLALVESA